MLHFYWIFKKHMSKITSCVSLMFLFIIGKIMFVSLGFSLQWYVCASMLQSVLRCEYVEKQRFCLRYVCVFLVHNSIFPVVAHWPIKGWKKQHGRPLCNGTMNCWLKAQWTDEFIAGRDEGLVFVFFAIWKFN